MTRDMERRRLRVYVAGPISTGDVFENVHNAIRWGKRMVRDGLAPYVPHFDAYMLAQPEEISWNAYLEWDAEWVSLSEAIFRLDGESKGATVELELAASLGIPVFYESEYLDLLVFAEERGLTGVRQ